MKHEVLARKWRPHRFEDVVGQPHVVQALSNALTQQYLHHAYLFTGTRGVGKTTLARILAKCLNCEQGITASPCDQCSTCQEIDSGRFVDLFEVDAASRTKVEDTRELLDNVQYAPSKGRYKIYLIDEVHMLSGHSFNALLKTLEEPPAHVKFLLATTDPQRLPATVLSRCLQFHLMQMTPEQIATRLQTILTAEKIPFDAEATLLIGQAADGSMRDALSLLDQSIAYGNGAAHSAEVKTMLGTIEPTSLYTMLQALQQNNTQLLLESAAQLALHGADFSRALTGLLTLLHQISVLQLVPNANNHSAELSALAQQLSPEKVQLYYQIVIIGQRDLAYAPTPRIGFEMTLLRMAAFALSEDSSSPSRPKLAIPAAKSPAQSAPTQTTPAAIAPVARATAESGEWSTLLPQLNLSGAALILAQQCSLQQRNEQEFQFNLDPKQKALYNVKYIARIEAALSDFFAKPIKVTIQFGAPISATPAELQQRLQQEQQAVAEQAIYTNETVQRIVQAFDATIVKESITPQGA